MRSKRSATARLALVYSCRTPAEFAYLAELNALAADGRLRLTLTLTGEAEDWAHHRGRTAPAHFRALVQPSTVALVCGPPAMVAELPGVFASLGIPRERVITENW